MVDLPTFRANAGGGIRDVGGPLFLMVVPSLAVFVLTYAIIYLDGSFEKLVEMGMKVELSHTPPLPVARPTVE